MLDKDANFSGHPSAGRTYSKNRHRSFQGSQKTENSTFSQLCGKEPRRRLGNPQMFQHTHSHLFDIARSKSSFGNNTLRLWSGAETPRLHRPSLNKNNCSKAINILGGFWCAIPRKVLRSGDKNDHRLSEPSRNQTGVRKIARVNCQIKTVFDD